jgi:DNA-binding protein
METAGRTKNDNVVFVGKKGTMAYVMAVVTQFNAGMQTVVIKARGQAISRAVDTAEIVRQRFMTDASLREIKIGTEEVSGEEGIRRVSIIEITLAK